MGPAGVGGTQLPSAPLESRGLPWYRRWWCLLGGFRGTRTWTMPGQPGLRPRPTVTSRLGSSMMLKCRCRGAIGKAPDIPIYHNSSGSRLQLPKKYRLKQSRQRGCSLAK